MCLHDTWLSSLAEGVLFYPIKPPVAGTACHTNPSKRHVWSPSKDTFELMILKLFLLAGLLASASSQTAAEINAETIATLESGTKITKAPKASNAVSKASHASNKVDESTPHLPAQASGCQHIPNTNQS
jgi:hypothetical protein